MRPYQTLEINRHFFYKSHLDVPRDLLEKFIRLVNKSDFTCGDCGFKGFGSASNPTGFFRVVDRLGLYTSKGQYICVCPLCSSYYNPFHALSSEGFIPIFQPETPRSALSQLYNAILPVLVSGVHNLKETAKKINDSYVNMSNDFAAIYRRVEMVGAPSDVVRDVTLLLHWYSHKGINPEIEKLLDGIRFIPDYESFKEFAKYYQPLVQEYDEKQIFKNLVSINADDE